MMFLAYVYVLHMKNECIIWIIDVKVDLIKYFAIGLVAVRHNYIACTIYSRQQIQLIYLLLQHMLLLQR